MSPVNKAELLHQLFPHEIPKLLYFLQDICEVLLVEATEGVPTMIGDLTTGQIAESAKVLTELIELAREQFSQFAYDFSLQLFTGYKHVIAVYGLLNFVNIRKHESKKFSAMVNLLFND